MVYLKHNCRGTIRKLHVCMSMVVKDEGQRQEKVQKWKSIIPKKDNERNKLAG